MCAKRKPPHLATERGWGGENPAYCAECEVVDLYAGVTRELSRHPDAPLRVALAAHGVPVGMGTLEQANARMAGG